MVEGASFFLARRLAGGAQLAHQPLREHAEQRRGCLLYTSRCV
nr:hypothetical protein [Burkholderia plantarii]